MGFLYHDVINPYRRPFIMKKQLNVSKESNFSIDFYFDEFHDIYFKLTNNSNSETFETYFAGYEIHYWSN
ncbi:MAG: hypothetical protein ISR00_02890 [Flavobacteriales bacterium]|nr:hypothetical protein [Flavobacteriales bacterium]MBL6872879.1 hypothetical protein [Flavobacteriales bacterium]